LTVFVDANVLLDVVTIDQHWSQWSVRQLDGLSINDVLAINDVVYAEISVGYEDVEQVDELIAGMGLKLLPISRPALFLAAKVHERYRKAGGARPGVLPDFFIGAQALVEGAPLLTRDARRYRTYFPQLELIAP
jgi:predicted nucleic acid-binding protein